jgi:hypothetical protein
MLPLLALLPLLSTSFCSPVTHTAPISVDPGANAGPSLLPAKRCCDISGHRAKYVHPRTKMWYCSAACHAKIEALSRDSVEAYLKLRNANVQLR